MNINKKGKDYYWPQENKSLKKLAFKFFTPSCFNANKPITDKKSQTSKEISSQRLSLSDLSNSSVCTVLSDLSNSLIGSNLHIFSHNELKKITQSFSKGNYLGEGGFGQVYKGFIDDKLRPGLEAQPVAVKAELIFLGQLKHPNLVNLIGYCCKDGYRLLLELQKASVAPEEEKPVTYLDFKTTNILLDSLSFALHTYKRNYCSSDRIISSFFLLDYTAKLSDFGLAINGLEGDETHITTRAMGTHGYAAPEYVKTGHLTTMSDVYSFGVVLLELLTSRRSVDDNRHGSRVSTRPYVQEKRLHAHQGLSHNPKYRPTTSSVVKTLEPLMNLTNYIPIGPFVYIVPTEGKNKVSAHRVERVGRADCDVVKNESTGEEKLVEKKAQGRHRSQEGHRFRNRIKSLRSSTVYSDTAVYRVLGTGFCWYMVQPMINVLDYSNKQVRWLEHARQF
ncbi:unnamed protein product [Malus baccata var. baccata]